VFGDCQRNSLDDGIRDKDPHCYEDCYEDSDGHGTRNQDPLSYEDSDSHGIRD